MSTLYIREQECEDLCLLFEAKSGRPARNFGRGQLKCDGTRAETTFHLSAKRTSPFESAGASVQSTTGSRGVRISGSNAGYTMFRGSVKGTGYPLHSPVSPSLPSLRYRVPSHFIWSINNDLVLLIFNHLYNDALNLVFKLSPCSKCNLFLFG